MLDDAQKRTERTVRVSFDLPLRKSFWRLRLIFAVVFLVAAAILLIASALQY